AEMGVAQSRRAARQQLLQKENPMPLIQVQVIKGVFSQEQKRQIISKLTDAMVSIEGENMRQVTLCLVEEVEWGCGAVAVGRAYLLPPLSSGGASLVRPLLVSTSLSSVGSRTGAPG